MASLVECARGDMYTSLKASLGQFRETLREHRNKVINLRGVSNDLSVDMLGVLEHELLECLADVRSFKNAGRSLTYNRLPEEVLVQIFAAVVTPLPAYASEQLLHGATPELIAAITDNLWFPSPPKQRPFQWIAVTHVCRYWRAAALNYPKLWSNIIIDPNDCPSHISRMFLNRASQSDLHVLVRLSSRNAVENPALEALISASDRIAGLYILQSPDIALRFLEQPLPRLATLVYPNYHSNLSNALAKHSVGNDPGLTGSVKRGQVKRSNGQTD